MQFKKILFYTILCFIIFGFTVKKSIDKGTSGYYFISGTTYLNKKKLSNEKLEVKFGDNIDLIEIDNDGKFEYKVNWVSPCMSGAGAYRGAYKYEYNSKGEVISIKKDTSLIDRMNPEFINIRLKEKSISINNEWKKYVKFRNDIKDSLTYHFDLHF